MAKCRWCGENILWVRGRDGRLFSVEAALTGYRKEAGRADALVTKDGYPIYGAKILTRQQEAEGVDGYAHRPHAVRCMKRRRE